MTPCRWRHQILVTTARGAGRTRAVFGEPIFCSQPDLVTGPTHDGWEHSPGGIIPGKASFHQARAVVTHKSGGLVLVTHGVWCLQREGAERCEFVMGVKVRLCLTHLHFGDAQTPLPQPLPCTGPEDALPAQGCAFFAMGSSLLATLIPPCRRAEDILRSSAFAVGHTRHS